MSARRRPALVAVVLLLPIVLYARSAYRGQVRQGLFDAIDRDDPRQVQALLDKGADPNVIDGSEDSAWRHLPGLHRAVLQEKPEIVRILLEKGAKPDPAGVDSYSPLAIAARKRNPRMARMLLEHGANPQAALPSFDTSRARPGMYALFREHGAQFPLDIAIVNGDSELALQELKGGTDPNAPSAPGGPPPVCLASTTGEAEVVRALLERGARPNVLNDGRQTPLSLAINARSPETVEVLIKHGADVNAAVRGRTMLVLARERARQAGVDERQAAEKIVNLLLKSGAKETR